MGMGGGGYTLPEAVPTLCQRRRLDRAPADRAAGKSRVTAVTMYRYRAAGRVVVGAVGRRSPGEEGRPQDRHAAANSNIVEDHSKADQPG